MIHATDGCSTQHFHSTQRDDFRRAKDIINAPVVDGSLACVAPQVTEIFQQVSIRFTIVLRIVSEKVGLISDAHFEIEVARNERNLAFSVIASPVNHVSDKCTAARRAEGIGMGAHEHKSGQVLTQTEVCSGCTRSRDTYSSSAPTVVSIDPHRSVPAGPQHPDRYS